MNNPQNTSVTRTIAKNAFFNFITHASDSLVNFGVGVLLARYLGAADYGLYSFLIWFLYFLALFANLGLGHMVIRYIAEAIGKRDHGAVKNTIGLAIWIRIGIAGLLMVIVMAFSGFWSDVFGYPENTDLFIILSVAFFPHVLTFILSSVFQGFQKFEYSAYIMLGTNPLRALGIVIVVAMGLGVKEVLFASLGSWVVGVLLGVFLLSRLIPLKEVVEIPQITPQSKSALKYSAIMFGVFLIGYFMTQRAEILFLGIFHPGEAVAFYAVAFLLTGSSIGLILSVFSTVLTPALSEQFGRGDIERIRTIFVMSARYLMIMGIPLALGGIALADPIIHVIYGSEYAPVIPILRILFIPFAFLSIASSATSIIYAVNKPSFVFKVGLVLVVISIGLDLWLIPIYGAPGAAVASSVARLIAPIFYIRFASRACQSPWPIKDTFKIALSSIVMGGVVFLIEGFIDIPAVDLVLLIPLGIVIHFSGLIILRVITPQDIVVIRRIQDGLPSWLGKILGVITRFLERFINIRKVVEK